MCALVQPGTLHEALGYLPQPITVDGQCAALADRDVIDLASRPSSTSPLDLGRGDFDSRACSSAMPSLSELLA